MGVHGDFFFPHPKLDIGTSLSARLGVGDHDAEVTVATVIVGRSNLHLVAATGHHLVGNILGHLFGILALGFISLAKLKCVWVLGDSFPGRQNIVAGLRWHGCEDVKVATD